jgi:hypothetical protein
MKLAPPPNEPERDDQAVERNDQDASGRPEEKYCREDECFGNRDRGGNGG